MSVRRLADEQPASFAFTPENEAWAKKEIAKYPAGRQASAVIALLWRAQEQEGYWLSRPAIERVGDMLAMPYIRVLEVATFYSMFNLSPVGKFHVQLCGTTPCMLRGAEDLRKVCELRIGPAGHVSSDGKFSWVEVECLGACCNAPMAQVNSDTFDDLDPSTFAKLLDDLAAGRPVTPGSQIGRMSSEPVGGLTALTTLYGADGHGAPANSNVAPSAPAVFVVEAPPPVVSPAPAIGAAPGADRSQSEHDAHAAAEEAHVKGVLATLPKDATPEQKANAVGVRPAGVAAAREGKADELQRVKGIGPVNEKKLHELGIFHFDQIANWARDEIRWVSTFLSFPGRIDRERWVSQAGDLVKGGAGSKGDPEPKKH